MLWLGIIDPSYNMADTFFSINIFRTHLESLEKIYNDGAVIYFHNLRVQAFGEKIMGVASHDVSFAVYANVPRYSLNCQANQNEEEPLCLDSSKSAMALDGVSHIVADLRKLLNYSSTPNMNSNITATNSKTGTMVTSNANHEIVSVSASSGKRKQLTVAEVPVGMYFNLVAEVLSIDVRDAGSQAVMAVTDYTSNDNCQTEFNDIRHIPKEMILPVTLWDNQAEYGSGYVKQGSFIFMDNLRSKSRYGALEAMLHKDNRVKIKIIEPSDPRLATLLDRKSKFTSIPAGPTRNYTETECLRPLFTIEEILSFKRAPLKFCTRVKFERCLPEDFCDFVRWESPDGDIFNSKTVANRSGRYDAYFQFYILVSDETGYFPLLFCKDDINHLLPDIKPGAFHVNQLALATFLQSINDIIGKTFEISLYSFPFEQIDNPADKSIKHRFLALHGEVQDGINLVKT